MMTFFIHIETGKLRQPFFRCSMAFIISYTLKNLLENNAAENSLIMLPDESFGGPNRNLLPRMASNKTTFLKQEVQKR